MKPQRRGVRITMTDDERDAFLRYQPVCRVATVGPSGRPHASALWYVWDGSALWLNSLIRSRRWADLTYNPQLSVVIDDGGKDFGRLRGVELTGAVQIIGEVPRAGVPVDVLAGPERLFAVKYMDGGDFRYDGRHGWLMLAPDATLSWDFAKLGTRVEGGGRPENLPSRF
jgi:hypothetical protein